MRKLIDAANEQGGKDNITAVIVTVGDLTARDVSRAEQLQLKRDMLARMPLFRPLNDREILRVLEVTDVASYQNGERVITEGEKGEELYIVLRGNVKVMRGDVELTTLHPGDHVGEMALVRSQPRSATVVSDGLSELMVIRRSDFYDILRKEHQLAVKLLWQFLGVLADRLRRHEPRARRRARGARRRRPDARDLRGRRGRRSQDARPSAAPGRRGIATCAPSPSLCSRSPSRSPAAPPGSVREWQRESERGAKRERRRVAARPPTIRLRNPAPRQDREGMPGAHVERRGNPHRTARPCSRVKPWTGASGSSSRTPRR